MKHQSGQVLLITIMLLATAITIALTVSFKSTTDTQVTKMEEEQQKALAAAEAALDAALKNKANATIGIGDLSSITGFSGQATVDETYSKPYFVSPLLQKDEQYVFYLTAYNSVNNTFPSDYSYPGGIDYYFNSENDCVALELTSVRHSDKAIRKAVMLSGKSGCGTQISGSGFIDVIYNSSGYTVDNETFYSKTNISGGISNTNLLIARPLFSNTKVAVKTKDTTNLPPQGKIVTSTAKSTTGVTKKIELFQSYPQIPAEFFVTRYKIL